MRCLASPVYREGTAPMEPRDCAEPERGRAKASVLVQVQPSPLAVQAIRSSGARVQCTWQEQ
eukprot:10236868-Alexandrium_andersonii.AAC.1